MSSIPLHVNKSESNSQNPKKYLGFEGGLRLSLFQKLRIFTLLPLHVNKSESNRQNHKKYLGLSGFMFYGTFLFLYYFPSLHALRTNRQNPKKYLGLRGFYNTSHFNFLDYSYEHLQKPPMYKPPEVSIIIYIIRGF